MQTNPKISVIIPCFNQGIYLTETVQSVLAQTYQTWEAIIVNDGSLDNTAQVGKELSLRDSRIFYIEKENGGASAARNFGIDSSRGELILPLDADDLIHPDYMAAAVELFCNNADLSLVYAKARKFDLFDQPWELRPYNYKALLEGNMIHCSAFFKKAEFKKIGGYDEGMKRGMEDWEFLIRFLNEESKVFRIEDEMFYYRTKAISMTTSISANTHMENCNYIYLKHKPKYDAHFGDPISLINQITHLKRLYQYSTDYRLGNRVIGPIRHFNLQLRSLLERSSAMKFGRK